MKKFFIIFALVIIGCAQSTSFVGPTYTMAKSGSILQQVILLQHLMDSKA